MRPHDGETREAAISREDARALLIAHNAWRRDRSGELTQTDPTLLGRALETAIAALTTPSPAVLALVEAVREHAAAEAAWREAQVNSTGDESPAAWRKEAEKQWQRLGIATRARDAALQPFTDAQEVGR
jgi:hypothetical protein